MRAGQSSSTALLLLTVFVSSSQDAELGTHAVIMSSFHVGAGDLDPAPGTSIFDH